MAKYIDGFVFPVPKKNLAAYKKMAKEGAKIWKQFGALEYYECVGNDLKPKKMGGVSQRSFKEMAGAGTTDTAWFSLIVYKNKKHRDEVNKKVMKYFTEKYKDIKDFKMPFDETKMAQGGFSVEVEG